MTGLLVPVASKTCLISPRKPTTILCILLTTSSIPLRSAKHLFISSFSWPFKFWSFWLFIHANCMPIMWLPAFADIELFSPNLVASIMRLVAASSSTKFWIGTILLVIKRDAVTAAITEYAISVLTISVKTLYFSTGGKLCVYSLNLSQSSLVIGIPGGRIPGGAAKASRGFRNLRSAAAPPNLNAPLAADPKSSLLDTLISSSVS